jgi:protein pelota
VEAVQQKGGEVVIFSSMHESGQREYFATAFMFPSPYQPSTELNQLTGIAAILTFPLDVEIVEAEEREEEEARKRQEIGEVEGLEIVT